MLNKQKWNVWKFHIKKKFNYYTNPTIHADRFFIQLKIIKKSILNFFSWENATKIFTLNYFRFLVSYFSLTPIIASSLNSATNSICQKNEKSIYCTALISINHLPFSWEILWFSSVFYLFSMIVYLSMCPNFIRKYKNIQFYDSLKLPSDYIKYEWRNFLEKYKIFLMHNYYYNNKKFNFIKNCLKECDFTIYMISEKYKHKDTTFLHENLENKDSYFYIVSYLGDKKITISPKSNSMKREIYIEKCNDSFISLYKIYENSGLFSKFICYTLLFISFFLFIIVFCESLINTILYIHSSHNNDNFILKVLLFPVDYFLKILHHNQ